MDPPMMMARRGRREEEEPGIASNNRAAEAPREYPGAHEKERKALSLVDEFDRGARQSTPRGCAGKATGVAPRGRTGREDRPGAAVAESVQAELAVDRPHLGRPDQARVCDRDRVQRPFQAL